MVRVGGLQYAIDPRAKMGSRITRMTLGGKPIDAAKTLQGRRLGAGLGGGQGRRRRADLGRDGALPARAEDDRAARAQPAGDRGRCTGQSRVDVPACASLR